ncbi:MAG: ADP-ribosylglycohydrolase family protein [Actinomycetaceae bacterium]|nr:ADP-ribosylglycohydrolase family protein [Actinomycetaceae bacterium]
MTSQAHTIASLRAVAPMHIIADRGAGVLVGQACGDALGVPYEFKSPKLDDTPHMIGGGMGDYSPGEWSDDTQLAICIAEVAVTGIDLTTEEALDAISQRYIAWLQSGQRELDAQTRVVIEQAIADDLPGRPAQKMRRSAAYFHRRTNRSSGSGALARTAIIGLSRLNEPEWTAAAARTVAELTHVDPLAGDSCVLMCETIRQATLSTLEGKQTWNRRFRIEAGLDLLPASRRDQWKEWLDEARDLYFKPPMDNTFTVGALQASLGAITAAILDSKESVGMADWGIRRSIENAVRVGGDTDTIAAITGAMVGACVGAMALPREWTKRIHGWPGFKMDALVDLGIGAAMAGLVGPEGMAHAMESGMDFSRLIEAEPDSGGTDADDE